jgi:hypothetical protein
MLVGIAHSAEPHELVVSLFQTEQNLQIVAAPERVEVCILYPKKPWFSRKHPTKYREGRYATLSSTDAALVSNKLIDQKTYNWDSAKACMPTFNARLRFHRANQVVEADLCFDCDIIVFRKMGSPLGGEDIDSVSGELFEIVRFHFPHDRVVHLIIAVNEERKQNRLEIEEAIQCEAQRKGPP